MSEQQQEHGPDPAPSPRAASWRCAMSFAFLDVPDDSTLAWGAHGEPGQPATHATRGGRCALVGGRALIGWAAGLVGVAVTGVTETDRHLLLDLDELAELPDEAEVVGATIDARWRDGRSRQATLTPDEVWDALVGLAEGGGEQEDRG